MADRITKRDKFGILMDVVLGSDSTNKEMLVEFINHETALLDKKATAKSGPTKAQLANEGVKAAIVDTLVDNGPMKSSAIAAELEISVQKCTALLRQLVMDGRVVRDESDKKAVVFSVPTGGDEE